MIRWKGKDGSTALLKKLADMPMQVTECIGSNIPG